MLSIRYRGGAKPQGTFERITKAFFNHRGRPGKVGGSVAREAIGDALPYLTEKEAPPPEAVLLHQALTLEQRAQLDYHVADLKSRLTRDLETYKVHSVNGDGTGGYTPERLERQREIMDEMIAATSARARVAAGETPTLTIVGGRGGSGKTLFKKSLGKPSGMYDETAVLTVDADEIKQRLMEKDGIKGQGHLAPVYHIESGHITNRLLARARNERLNVAYDATLKSDKPYLTENFRKRGYRIEAHYMHLPRVEAAKRALGRYASGTHDGLVGRLVPPSVVYSNTHNERNFNRLVGRGVDKWSFWDNNVPRGADPVRIAGSD